MNEAKVFRDTQIVNNPTDIASAPNARVATDAEIAAAKAVLITAAGGKVGDLARLPNLRAYATGTYFAANTFVFESNEIYHVQSTITEGNTSTIAELLSNNTIERVTDKETIATLVAEIAEIEDKTSDLEVIREQNWIEPTNADFFVINEDTTLDAAVIGAATWVKSVTIPNITNINIVVRLPAGGNPGDYRIVAADDRPVYVGLKQKRDFSGLSGGAEDFDYYVYAANTGTGDYYVGGTLKIQHHGIDAHTRYHGKLDKEEVTEAIGDELASLEVLENKTVDLEVIEEEVWDTATDGTMAFLDRDIEIATVQSATFAVSVVIPNTGARSFVIKLPLGANVNDYRVFGETGYSFAPTIIKLNLGALSEANDYYTTSLPFLRPGFASGKTITLQHHGTEPHTRYHGDLDNDKVKEALGDDLVDKSVEDKTVDLEVIREEQWVTATDGVLTVLQGTIDLARLEAVTDWASSFTVPDTITDDTYLVVTRLARGANKNDYQVIDSDDDAGSVGPRAFYSNATYDFYFFSLPLTDKPVGTVFTLEHHGLTTHTKYHGDLVRQKIIDQIADLLGTGTLTPEDRQAIIDALRGQVSALTAPEQAIIDGLLDKTVDIQLTKTPVWDTATLSEGTFAIVQNDNITNVVLTGITTWGVRQTIPGDTGSQEHIVYRLPKGANPTDYAILDGNNYRSRNPGDPQALLRQIASVTDYDYYIEEFHILPGTGYAEGTTLTLQYHGEAVHTKYFGDLIREKIVEALGELLIEHTPKRVDTLPASLEENEIVVLTQTYTSGSTSYRKGMYAGKPDRTPELIRLPTNEIFADALSRLLPPFPPSGERVGKILKWLTDDAYSWILDTSTSGRSGDHTWYVDFSPNKIDTSTFKGVFTVYLHDVAVDEARFEDVAYLVVRLNGFAVYNAAWTRTDGARAITFTISDAHAAVLTRDYTDGDVIEFETAFEDAARNELFAAPFFTIAGVPNLDNDSEYDLPKILQQTWEIEPSDWNGPGTGATDTESISFLASHDLISGDTTPSQFREQTDSESFELLIEGTLVRNFTDDGVLTTKITQNGVTVVEDETTFAAVDDSKPYKKRITIDDWVGNNFQIVSTTRDFNNSTRIRYTDMKVRLRAVPKREVATATAASEPVFSELPIRTNITMPKDNVSAPAVLSFGTPANKINESGVIGLASGNNAITLKKGAYRIQVRLVVNNVNSSNPNARMSLASYIYNSSGTEIQARKPMTGYNRNLGADMTEVAFEGEYYLVMASDGRIDIRAKIYQIGLAAARDSQVIQTAGDGQVLIQKL